MPEWDAVNRTGIRWLGLGAEVTGEGARLAWAPAVVGDVVQERGNSAGVR